MGETVDRTLIGKLFRDVPPERTAELLDFVEHHPPRAAEVAGVPFEYLVAGSGPRTLLLLPGLLGNATSLYRQVLDFEADHRVIALSYPDVDDVDVQLAAISAVLDAEGVERAVAVGQTLGGYLAQAWAWSDPERVDGLVLVHAGLPDPRLGKRVAGDVRRLRWLPSFLLRRYLQGVLLRMVATQRSRGEVDDEQEQLVAAQLRYRFARLVNKAQILSRYRLISRLHAAPVPDSSELARLGGRVLAVYAESSVFTRNLDRLRELYPGLREVVFGRGHNISLLIKPRESNESIRQFLDLLPTSNPSERGENVS